MLIASPWSARMPETYGTGPGGIAAALLTHGQVYAVFMPLGVLLVRVPPPAGARVPEQPGPRVPARANGPDRPGTGEVSAAGA